MRKLGNARAVETILVAKSNQALPVGGTTLVDNTTGTLNIADGQLAVIDASARGTNALSACLSAGDTVANSPVIRIVQGKANVDNMELSAQLQRPYEISGDIEGAGVVAYKGKTWAQSTRSTFVVGAVTGNAGAVNVEDNSEYFLNVAYRGRRVQEYDTSTHGSYSRRFTFTSPEYSTLGLSNSLDHLVQNLGYVVNRDSRQFNFNKPSFGANQPVFALALDSTGGGAGVAITAVAGTVVPVVVTSSGITKSITLDAELVATLAEVVAAGTVPNTAKIIPINLSTAGTKDADQLLLVAMNEQPAYVDRIPFLKIRLQVGLGGAFATSVTSGNDSPAFEGEGTYHQWKIYYDNTAGQRQYSQYRGFETLKIEVPSDLNPTAEYDAYIIEHFTSYQLNLANTSVSPQKTIILVPKADTVTSAAIEAVLNPWMASTPGQFPALTL